MGDDTTVNVIISGNTYTLNPGCTVTFSVNKEIVAIVPVAGENPILQSMGRTENFTIRADTHVGSAVGAMKTMVDYIGMMTTLIAADATESATFTFGGNTFGGLVRNITAVRKPGEGETVDLSVTFEVGSPAA